MAGADTGDELAVGSTTCVADRIFGDVRPRVADRHRGAEDHARRPDPAAAGPVRAGPAHSGGVEASRETIAPCTSRGSSAPASGAVMGG